MEKVDEEKREIFRQVYMLTSGWSAVRELVNIRSLGFFAVVHLFLLLLFFANHGLREK